MGETGSTSAARSGYLRVARQTGAACLNVVALLVAACGGSGGVGPPPAGENVLAIVSGDGQHARVTRELVQPIVIIVRNASGSAVAGASVTFAPSSGTVGTTRATTDANGQATVRWTLGTTAGPQTLTVRFATGTGAVLTINATADPAVVVSILASDGDRQQAVVGTAVGVTPSVIVRAVDGAPASGVAVRFTVTAGGGAVEGATATTDANGKASAGRWILGFVAGTNALTVSPVDGDIVAPVPLVFTAVAVPFGGSASSPVRSYSLNASGATTLQDTVTGLVFAFPSGAHGTLEVARILSGPAAPLPGVPSSGEP